jgi:protein CpxP
MKRWIKRTLFTLFGATVAIGGLTACSHRHEGQGWQSSSPEDQARFRGRMIDRVAGKLDLNEDQKKRLGVVADKLREQRQAVVGQTSARTEVQALVAGDKFDRARAQALVAEKTAAINSKGPEVITALGDFYDSLTPAQQAKVRDYMQHRHGWWRRG